MVQARAANGRFTKNGSSQDIIPPSPLGPWDKSVQMHLMRGLLENAKSMTENLSLTRSDLARDMGDPRRDIYADAGYPRYGQLETRDYQRLYDRESIARRVVEVLPKESWLIQPSIFEDEDTETETQFEVAWRELPKMVSTQGGPSWLESEEGNPVWDQLLRADEISGIGPYGVLMIGLDDGLELNQPAAPRKGRQVTFFRTFGGEQINIARLENDPMNSRFGRPVAYNIRFSQSASNESEDGQETVASSDFDREVHWTRVIHVADNLSSSEIFGTPRLQVPYNRLWDLVKLYAGSGEMYWQGAMPGVVLTTHPQLGLEAFLSDAAKTDMKRQLEDHLNGLQRWIALQGMKPESLAPQVVDPTPQIDAYLKAICIQIGIPKRIFEGSERGELSSSQDAKSWAARLSYRQDMYLTPRVIAPFIDRLIWLGVLPEPEKYSVVWPDMETLTEIEKAEVAAKRMEAASMYVQGGVEGIMTPLDLYKRVLNMPAKDAEAVIEAAMDAIAGGDTTTFVDPTEKEEVFPMPGEGGK